MRGILCDRTGCSHEAGPSGTPTTSCWWLALGHGLGIHAAGGKKGTETLQLAVRRTQDPDDEPLTVSYLQRTLSPLHPNSFPHTLAADRDISLNASSLVPARSEGRRRAWAARPALQGTPTQPVPSLTQRCPEKKASSPGNQGSVCVLS